MATNMINSLEFGNNTHPFSLPYGVCETASATAAKTVTVDNFSLEAGAIVVVKFVNANSVASPTLNVNGTGAKPIMRYGTTTLSTGTTTTGWVAGAVQMFVYDGTNWIRDYWYNTTYSNVALGQGYTTCSTAATTTAKTASLSSYALTTGGIVSVKFTYDVPANATLNINSEGAKAIYHKGAAITANVIKAGDTATFIYNGSYYHLISLDQAAIIGAATTILRDNLTASRALVSDASGKVAVSAVTSTELGYLDGVTSAIQTQLNAKVPTSRTINGKALSANITLSASDVGAAPTEHTHNYAGSATAGGSATSAVKLDTATAGSTTQPSYFTGGKPAACTYSLNATVPSGAVFTDKMVEQTSSSAVNYRPLLMHALNGDAGVDPGTATDKVYYNAKISACASTGDLFATTFTGDLVGTADYADALSSAVTINGTTLQNAGDNITTTKWGTARSINIVSSDGTGGSTAVSIDGSNTSGYSLKLPGTIKANLTGTATKVSNALTVGSKTYDGSSAVEIKYSDIGGLDVSRALCSSSSGNVAASTTTSTELARLSGVTSNVQTQLDTKLALNPASIELMPGTSADHGGFIDFHYNGSTANNTSRIIESGSGTLQINSSTFTTSRASVPTLTITNTSGTSHLQFSRTTNYNYIHLPMATDASGGVIAFCINPSVGSSESQMIIGKTTITPGTTNTISLGSSSRKWSAIYGTKVYGAIWNDYAEYRQYKPGNEIPYGHVVIENGDDTLSLSSYRLQKGGNICSDTFGFAIGETEKAQMPIAVSGRALVYTNEDRNSYEPGDAVCTGPNGTISKMTREEIKEYPDCIIGYVSAIPDYETWGENHTPVDGRIWIKVV